MNPSFSLTSYLCTLPSTTTSMFMCPSCHKFSYSRRYLNAAPSLCRQMSSTLYTQIWWRRDLNLNSWIWLTVATELDISFNQRCTEFKTEGPIDLTFCHTLFRTRSSWKWSFFPLSLSWRGRSSLVGPFWSKLHPCSAQRGRDLRGCDFVPPGSAKRTARRSEITYRGSKSPEVDLSRSYENDRSHGNFFQTGFEETAFAADGRGKQNYRFFN